jgi:uroporphyrinogen-III synthase
VASAKNTDLKVKSILVTQPKPETDKSPYADLQKKYNLKIDFREFIHVEGVPAQEFRQQRVNIAEHSAVILTSRNAVDHFFRICQEMRVTVPDTLKYFCISESTAFYLQKYVQYRKRRIFHGKATINELIDIIKKHKEDKFLYPCTDVHKEDIPEILDKHKIQYSKAVIYRTVCSDLSDLADVFYDILVFFSPSGITSLYKNFPKFKQNKTRIAAFGPATAKAIEEAGLRLDIHAPKPGTPSMTMALEEYIKQANKK